MATQTAVKAAPPPLVPIRRFEVADLSKHGGWIMRRLQKAYPHQNDRSMAGWLREIIGSNEFLFLYQEHAVALAQTLRTSTLDAKPIIMERFVFAEEGHVDAAAEFYGEFALWAKRQEVTTIVVEEMSDVPHEMIRERLGRLFTRQQVFARL